MISQKYHGLSTKEVFTTIYDKNIWWSDESFSWPWSEYAQTVNIRKWILETISKYDIKTFIDAPCGDVNWIRPDQMWITYIWCDIVENLILTNRKKFHSDKISFKQLDITKDWLPEWDLIHCRECLQHLSEKNINNFIRNLKTTHIKYLLTTTHDSLNNINIVDWDFFPINLEIYPYDFPKPICKIEELERNLSTWEKKFLALWRIDDFS